MKAIVLYGDVPETAGQDDQDTLVQVETVCRALSELGHTPVALPLSMNFKETIDALERNSPDFIFNLVESIDGHGNLIHVAPSVMDALDIPYTGAKTDAMFLTSNKVLAKKILAAEALPTPRLFLADENNDAFAEGSYIVKAIWEHASSWLDDSSIVHVRDGNDLRQVIMSQHKKLRVPCFAEPFIEGREFNLSLLAGNKGLEVLPPAEIQFQGYPPGKAKVVDYRAKWVEDSFEYRHTPRCFDFPKEDAWLLQQLTDLAMRCWEVFVLRGYARVDFRVDKNNVAWILEVNANPCLSPDGGFAAAVHQAGLTFNQAIERIVKDSFSF
jgi:D-alanine-D-alanine ligase